MDRNDTNAHPDPAPTGGDAETTTTDQGVSRPRRRRSAVLGATPGAANFRRKADDAPGRAAADATSADPGGRRGLELAWPEVDLPGAQNAGTDALPAMPTPTLDNPAALRTQLDAADGQHTTQRGGLEAPTADRDVKLGKPAEPRESVDSDPGRRRRWRPTWKSAGSVLVAAGVAVWVARGLVGTDSPEPSPAAVRPPKATVTKRQPSPPPSPAVVAGQTVRRAGTLVTLNPGIAQPGGQVALAGYGFDAGSTVDVTVTADGEPTETALGTFRADKTGNVSATLTMPDNVGSGALTVTVRQRNSDKVATVQAAASAGLGYAKIDPASGKPGDTIAVTARGFTPGEKINAHWGTVSGTPTSVLQADAGGSISQASVKVGFQPPGSGTLVLVGAKSGTTATANFYMQGLYPGAASQPYSLKAGEALSLSGSGFAPEERVQIFLNASSGEPLTVATADGQGNVSGPQLQVPFGLKGEQRVVMLGELSKAAVTTGFAVLPYTPSVQPSTYGGAPGTSFSFFAKEFAPDEVVLVHLQRTPGGPGELVSAFRVDERGAAGAAGSYQIASGDSGTLKFTLIGRRSDGRASASVRVSAAEGPVDLPPREPYTLPAELRKD